MECLIEIVDIQLFNIEITFRIGSSYIINKYIYSSILIHREINQLFATLKFSGREIDMTYVGSCLRQFSGKLFRSFFRIVSDDYFTSFRDDATCGCFANTTGSTSDDNYFIFESIHILGI